MLHIGKRQNGIDISDLEVLPIDRNVSVMRRFLESGEEFRWPADVGECHGNHCNLPALTPIPLEWRKRISDKKASIDIYRGDVRFSFKQPFVVKTIRESSYVKSRSKASQEVNTMRDLQHPHVAALLGTFLYQDRLSILIFPAACCDLHRYMKSITKEIMDKRQEKIHAAEAPADGPQTPDSTTSSASGRHIAPNIVANIRKNASNGEISKDHYEASWLLKLPYVKKLDSLRSYFVCLSQAVTYLHDSDVRHKDIKPENVLIDSSGSVIITDFGISRKFPKKASHVTNDDWRWTRKYASPEIMKGSMVPRDDSSDVFSLGCVFLEIATLILGRSLDRFTQHYATQINETATDDAYHCNLERVRTWLDFLKQPSEPERKPAKPLANAQIENQDFVVDNRNGYQRMIAALDTIGEMLSETPHTRPKAKDLWERFQWVSSERCRDCDPRHPEVWEPSTTQKHNNQDGKSDRLSLHTVSDESHGGPQMGNGDDGVGFGGIDSPLLSARDHPASCRQCRSSSPHIAKRVGSPISISNGKPARAGYVEKASFPNNRRLSIYNEGSTTSSENPRLPSPMTVSAIDGTRSDPNPRSSTSQAGRPHLEGRVQPGIVQESNSRGLPGKDTEKTSSGPQNTMIPEEPKPAPLTEVIIYDYSTKLVYVSRFASLRGRDYQSYALTRADQEVEIGGKPNIVAKANLSSLGFYIRIRRMKGDFPRIYVVDIPAG